MNVVSHVTISLLDIPKAGSIRLIPRVSAADQAIIRDAATILGMTQAQFFRTVVVNASKQVLEAAAESVV